MKTNKILIIIAAIFDILLGCLFGILGIFASWVFIAAAIKITEGVLLITSTKSDEEMFRKKGLYLGFGILDLFGNYISAILLFVARSKMEEDIKKINSTNNQTINIPVVQNVKKETEVISKEHKKIDILTKFGVFLIVISGLIFSTSDKLSNLSNITKPLFMAILSMLFYGLYYLFNKKIVIKSTSKTYYVLHKLFIIFTVICIFYFGTFGSDVTYLSNTYNTLCYSLSFLCASYCLVSISRKFNIKLLSHFGYSFDIISIILMLNFFDFDNIGIVGLLLIITMFTYLYKEKLPSEVKDITDLTFLLSSLYYLVALFDSEEFIFYKLLVGFFVIVLLRYRIVSNDMYAYFYRGFLPCYICSFTSILLINASFSCEMGSASELFISNSVFNYRVITIFIMLIYNYLFTRGKTKESINSGVISSFVISAMYIFTFLANDYSTIGLFVSIVLFIYLILFLRKAEKNILKITAFIIEIFSLIGISIYAFKFYTENGIYLSEDTIIFIFLILSMLVNLIQKKLFNELNIQKIVYNVLLIVTSCLSVIYLKNHEIVFSIINILSLFAYRFLIKAEEKETYVYNFAFILLIYCHLTSIFLNYTSILAGNIIILIALLIASYYINKEKFTPYLTLCLVYFPFLIVMSEINISEELFIIFTRLPLFILSFVIPRKLLCLNKKSSYIVEIILLSIVFLSYIFKVEMTLGIFTGILGLLMIFVGFKFEKYNSLFYVGIGVSILNIIVQLIDFWTSLPLYAYLLASGLLIVGYVTYKEIKKATKKVEIKEEEKAQVEIKEENKTQVEIKEENKIDSINIVINIVLIVSMLICYCIINENINEIRENNKYIEYFKSANLNSEEIYYSKEDDVFYVISGKHQDLEKIKEVYKKSEVSVAYVSKENFDNIKSSSNEYEYEFYDYDGYHTYYEEAETEFNVNGVKVKIQNDVNFLDSHLNDYAGQTRSYYYDENGTIAYQQPKQTSKLHLTYYKEDVDYLDVCFSGITTDLDVTVDDTSTRNIVADGCYKLNDSESLYISVSKPVNYYQFDNKY